MEYLLSLIDTLGQYPPLVVAILFIAIALFIPVTEELALLLGGFLAARVPGSWPLTMLVGLLGVVGTDVWAWWLAHRFGQPILQRPLIRRFLPARQLERAQRMLQRHGPRLVFLVRFIPGGLRVPTFMVCGLSGVRFSTFVLWSLAGAVLVMQISFWLGYSIGGNLEGIEALAERFAHFGKVATRVVLGLLLVGAAVAVMLIRRRRNRAAGTTAAPPATADDQEALAAGQEAGGGAPESGQLSARPTQREEQDAQPER